MTNNPLPSAAEMASFDLRTISGGVPARELMERAGKRMAALILDRLSSKSRSLASIVILCGPGNNGGDGVVIARELQRHKINVSALLTSASRYSEDLLTQLHLLIEEGGAFSLFGGNSVLPPGLHPSNIDDELTVSICQSASLIVDALLGTGQKESPRGSVADLLKIASEANVQVFSVDIPSGISGTTGEVFSPSIRASITATVECVKRGMLQYPGRTACGEIITVSIGLDLTLGAEFSILDAESAPRPPHREPSAHKGSAGRVAILAGSRNMPGAGVLSCLGALKTGAGLVYVASGEEGHGYNRPLEAILLKAPFESDGFFGERAAAAFGLVTETANAVVLGPGLGRSESSRDFVRSILKLIRDSLTPVVVDADALVALVEEPEIDLRGHVITPHPGEAARLLRCSTEEVQRDRYSAAKALHEKTSAVVVLKGASTIVYFDGLGVVNISGNPWMATGGTGDVLCGAIATFLAQGMTPYLAAQLAVYLHGDAGDRAHAVHGGPITASALAEMLPYSYGALLRSDVQAL